MPRDRTFSCPHPHKRGRNHCWKCEVEARRPNAREIADRFWSNVDRTDVCWWWRGFLTSKGYGQTSFRRRTTPAHHLAYFLTYDIKPKMLRHTCDNPACVRPDHLLTGTQADNIADKMARGRQAKGERIATAKMTVDQVRELRHLRAAGWKLRELAVRYGISQTTVSQTARGMWWRHV